MITYAASETGPPAVVAQTSVLDAHIVHGLDSTWHLCAFFVALEEETGITPALTHPSYSCGLLPPRKSSERELDRGAHGTKHHQCEPLQASARSLFGFLDTFRCQTIEPRSCLQTPRMAADEWRPASTASPLYGMHSRHVSDPELSGRHASSTSRSASWLRLSDTAEITCLLGAVQQGVIPDCSGRNEVHCAGLGCGGSDP